MNTDKLKQAEEQFLSMYPGGFENPEMLALAKKHGVGKMTALVQETFAEDQFDDPKSVVQSMGKIVSRASLVSLFEKPKFRDYVNSLGPQQEAILANGLKEALHSNHETGFNMMLDILIEGKLAKWSLISLLPVYHRPQKEVFVKPTTAKGVIQYFELEGLEYKPRPSWEFYIAYRKAILKMRASVDRSLSPNNAAFTGFLMMSLEK
ncbi:MAG: hypothetical protein K9M49_05080 [Candidatus Marinimicrobia bacterium]|nr:hypothetical protein [Candidatus Neomarinimicrobiota bacterium]MCF7904509.1 hypothetical protein [Candidatus Neomarinimicrobiota bacterium]